MAIIDETTWLTSRIESAQLQVEAYEAAILAISSGAQMYQMDTGQTRMLVTKANLSSVEAALNKLLLRMEVWKSQLCGRPQVGRPY